MLSGLQTGDVLALVLRREMELTQRRLDPLGKRRQLRHCQKTQGSPNVVLPSISSAAPVRALQRTASSAVKISPLAMTGMRTASRTARMLSQSARPE